MSVLSFSFTRESDVAITNIYQSLPHIMARKQLAYRHMKRLRHCHPMWTVMVCILFFGPPLVKRFALCYHADRCLSVCPVLSAILSVSDVGVLWPNGSMDQDETCQCRPWPHCFRWGLSFPSPKRGWSLPIFGPYLLWPNGWMDQDGTRYFSPYLLWQKVAG